MKTRNNLERAFLGSETEDIIMEKQANHQQKIFSIGGKLILTKTRLIFQPHGFNIGGKEIVMNLSDVVGIGKTQTMFGTSKEIWVNLKGHNLNVSLSGRETSS